MGYFHRLAFPRKIIAGVEMHHSPERSATARSRAMTGDSPAGPLPVIKAVGVFAGNQLAGREFS
jgi:hypothetical protein